MIDVNPFWIIIISTFGLFFLAFIILINAFCLFSKRFNILQYFPYEILKQRSPLVYIGKVFLFALSLPSLLTIIFLIINKAHFGDLLYLEIIIGAVSFFISLLYIIMSFIPVDEIKARNILVTFEMALTFLMSALTSFNGIYFYLLYLSKSSGSIAHLILGIVAGILAISSIILIFNPKLREWYKLQINNEDDGSETISRPRLFILAFSEWASLIISYLSVFIFIFELVKI